MQAAVQHGQAGPEAEGGAAGGVQREGVVFQQRGEARRVVCVLMGHQNGGEIVRRQAQQGQRLSDAAGGDAGIHQQVNAAGGEQQAVALGSAGQCV